MIQAVTSSHYPYLPIHVEIFTQQTMVFEFDIEPMVDTGFDGGLTVPQGLIPSSIAPFGTSEWKLADDTEVKLPAYIARVTIGSLQPIATLVIVLGDDPLLGRDVIDHFSLHFDHGHQLTVEP
jgi:predicted aspartyl protease